MKENHQTALKLQPPRVIIRKHYGRLLKTNKKKGGYFLNTYCSTLYVLTFNFVLYNVSLFFFTLFPRFPHFYYCYYYYYYNCYYYKRKRNVKKHEFFVLKRCPLIK